MDLKRTILKRWSIACNASLQLWVKPSQLDLALAAGALPENTLEALRNLIAADRKGSITDLHYVEFDVHVSLLLPTYACCKSCCLENLAQILISHLQMLHL